MPMVRHFQDHEAMQTVGVRMPVTLIAAIDLYRDKLKAQNPAFRIERGEAVRDLLLKALAFVGSPTDDQAAVGATPTPTAPTRARKKAPVAKG
jgi:hypothetical protein